jgi:hypothetical protein
MKISRLHLGESFAISIRLVRNAYKAFGNNADYHNDSAGGTYSSFCASKG